MPVPSAWMPTAPTPQAKSTTWRYSGRTKGQAPRCIGTVEVVHQLADIRISTIFPVDVDDMLPVLKGLAGVQVHPLDGIDRFAMVQEERAEAAEATMKKVALRLLKDRTIPLTKIADTTELSLEELEELRKIVDKEAD